MRKGVRSISESLEEDAALMEQLGRCCAGGWRGRRARSRWISRRADSRRRRSGAVEAGRERRNRRNVVGRIREELLRSVDHEKSEFILNGWVDGFLDIGSVHIQCLLLAEERGIDTHGSLQVSIVEVAGGRYRLRICLREHIKV